MIDLHIVVLCEPGWADDSMWSQLTVTSVESADQQLEDLHNMTVSVGELLNLLNNDEDENSLLIPAYY